MSDCAVGQATPSLLGKLSVAAAGGVGVLLITLASGGNNNLAALATFSMIAVAVPAYIRWDLRGEWWFWGVLVLISAAHIILLLKTSVAMPHPTILFAPMVYLDAMCILIVLRLAGRFFHRAR